VKGSPAVLFCIPSLEVGGSERHLVSLASAVVEAGGRALLAALRGGGPLAAAARQAGVDVRVLGRRERRVDVGASRQLGGLIRDWRPEVVHCCLFGFDLLAALPARLLGVPLVVGARRELADWMAGRHLAVQSAGNRFCHVLVCCSEAVRQRVLAREGVDPASVAVIRNGVDVERFRPDLRRRATGRQRWGVKPHQRCVVTVANIEPEKGYPALLEAARQVLRVDPEVRFLWAGEGRSRDRLLEAVRVAGLNSRVRLVGHVEDVAELLCAGDVFALASQSEGLPNALLEAMASGLPVVASRVGGIPEVVETDRNGLLVAPGRAAALAEAILRLCRSPEWASSLGQAARQRMAAWPASASHACYLNLYRGRSVPPEARSGPSEQSAVQATT
jgi:glycosyltransferase involved in cell wall biosynthesis